MKRLKFDLEACPEDVCDLIVELCVTRRITEFSKQGTRLLILLNQTSWRFRNKILELSQGWGLRFVQHVECLNPEMRQDWFSLTHVLLRRCFHCKKLCYQNVTPDTFNMLLHKACLMGLTETLWFFDFRMLNRVRVKERLGPMLCAVVGYYQLTPETIRKHIPFVSCTGNHPQMGVYTYQRIFVEPNAIVPPEHTLFGWLDLTPDRLETIRRWYTHKTHGYLGEVSKFPRMYRQLTKTKRSRASAIFAV